MFNTYLNWSPTPFIILKDVAIATVTNKKGRCRLAHYRVNVP